MSIGMEALNSVGITHQYLVVGAVCFIIAGVIGMFWHYIVPGAIIVGALVLFVDPSEIKPIEVTKKDNVQVFDEHAAYIKDCVEVAQYTKQQCEGLWNDRQVGEDEVEKSPINQVKLLDVDNEEYKARRAEALSKVNAVVIHETYH